ncbi:hypothetical protein H0H93_006359 [Arthromyces matolae]|nr:hypothetical protein H0H93_006359 [Arthromyces matolae]
MELHLELPPSTTSFKRSFDQFGFDLESPLGASDAVGSSLNDGNDRNKRARSASSFSDDDRSIESSSSSTLASASSSMSPGSANDSSLSSHILTAPRLTVPHLSLNIARSSLEPPRLPTPEIQDIDMTDYPLPEPEGVEEETSTSRTVVSTTSNASQAEENYRLSLERFNAFDTQISALRRSRSPSLPRAQTPPPVLPPLELLGAEAPINTNTISFLHPPAQPSPPLPHALYNYGPPRIQPSGSRTVSRNESLLDDPRRLPHETHLPPLPLVESSTASRGDPHPEEWDRITQNVRPTRDEGIGWNFWPPAAEEEDHDTEEEDNEEEEEEEVQEALEQHIGTRVWSSPIPNLGELLRTPTPFNPLDDLEFHHPPSVPSPRRREDTAPPTLPPIEDEVLSPIWQEPTLEEALDDAWGRWPNERPTSRSSLRSTSTQSHPPTPRLATLDRLPLLSERERAIIAEDISEAEATVGSSTTDETLPAQSGPPSSPLHEWLENPWFLRPDEPGPSARAEVETSTTHSNDSFNSGSGSSILDNYAAQRLQALQGIGTALEGIAVKRQQLRRMREPTPPRIRARGGLAQRGLVLGGQPRVLEKVVAVGTRCEAARSDWPTPYPPWRATQPPRVSPPEPSPSSSSELHDFLTRHPRSEALRREAEAAWGTPALRGDDEGFGRAVHALRHEVSSASRSQEPLHRARDVPQEPRTTWAPPMQWGTLEQGQAGSNHTNDSLLARRRRYPPLAGYFDDEDVESAFDRARFWARRSRGSGEAPVFPRRIGPLVRTGGPGAGYRRARPLGDYIRDEDWNGDYDTLISLAATLGDVKPRSTSDDVMATLETGLFKEWQTPESDHRCPICLDDYQADDILLKLADCSHWLHHECLRVSKHHLRIKPNVDVCCSNGSKTLQLVQYVASLSTHVLRVVIGMNREMGLATAAAEMEVHLLRLAIVASVAALILEDGASAEQLDNPTTITVFKESPNNILETNLRI